MFVLGGATWDIVDYMKGYTIGTNLAWTTPEFCGHSWGIWFVLLALVIGGEALILKKSKNAALFSTTIAIILPVVIMAFASYVS